MSILGRTILNASAGAKSAGSAASGSKLSNFASCYYKNYIATSSVKPLLHLIGIYCGVHWTITQVHKHKYQTKKNFH